MLLCFNEKAFYLKNNKIFVIIIIVNEKEMKKMEGDFNKDIDHFK